MTQFKTGWKGKTRDGRPARVIADDLKGDDNKNVLAVVITVGNSEHLTTRYQNGLLFLDGKTLSSHDLVQEPKTVERWVNIYPYGPESSLYDSKQEAEENSYHNLVKIIKVVIEY